MPEDKMKIMKLLTVRQGWSHHLDTLLYILLLLIWNTIQVTTGAPSFQPSGIKAFHNCSSNSKCYYRYFMLDESTAHLYVGGIERIYRLNLTDISRNFLISPPMMPIAMDVADCNSIQDQEDSRSYFCKNHIRVIAKVNATTLYICGTGANNPREFYLSIDRTSITILKEGARRSGKLKCPFDPNDNATAIWVENGNPDNIPALYSATIADRTKSDPVIYRPQLSSAYGLLRTVKHHTKWLNEPHFVGSFETEKYVYIFLRETAIEYINCGKAVYSRVARICKNDRGGNTLSLLKDKWTTFLKARLNCSIPGEFPFYFNEIQDVVKIGNKFYATFTTNLNFDRDTDTPYGSAVCSYDIQSLENAFNGKFKEQNNSLSNWVEVPAKDVPSPRPGTCQPDSKSLNNSVLKFIYSTPFMDSAVAMDYGRPLYYKIGTVFQKIAVQTQVTSKNYTVLYLGTNQGHVYKVSQWSNGAVSSSTNLNAVWQPFKGQSGVYPIWSMKYYSSWLYLGTDHQVSQIDIYEQCSLYSSCDQCVRDPHCGWHSAQNQCEQYTSGLKQDVTGSESSICSSAAGSAQAVVKSNGKAVLLNCSVTIPQQVQWFKENIEIVESSHKYIITRQGGLVILEADGTDNANYSCRLKGSSANISSYNLQLSNKTLEEQYEEKFNEWCQKYDEYKNRMEMWMQHAQRHNCLPTSISNTISSFSGG